VFVPLLGAPSLPTRWVKRSLWIISYKHVPNLLQCYWISVFINYKCVYLG
jgi:hypothetical protein